MTTIKGTKENFEQEVVKSDIPVVVDFWASWCGPCQMMGPVFEKLSREYSGKVKFVKVSVEEEQEIGASLQISSIPTLSVVRDGKEIGRMAGYMPEETLRDNIEEILAK